METKSNHIIVGIITLLMLALLAGFVYWLARYGEGDKKEYDIFFHQSVNGLGKGSGVAYSGVPIGTVSEIKLWEPDPKFVRVRIAIDRKVAIRLGTTATILSGFTGVSEILLEGAVKGAPRLVCPKVKPKTLCPAGRPTIPTKPGALGELLNNAPLLLERLSTLTERMTSMLSAKNQGSLEKILGNVETMSGSLAQQAPGLQAVSGEMQSAIAQSRATLQQASAAMDQLGATAGNANALINDQGKPTLTELRTTLTAANKSLAQMEATMKGATPALQNLNDKTLPEFSQMAKDVQKLSRSIESLSSRLDEDGSSFLLGSRPLPDYDAKKSK
jgi:phospholipid/cholesterol/gamma-HCH transport system substrate-binding protein